jgi:hypothetical protein
MNIDEMIKKVQDEKDEFGKLKKNENKIRR